MFRSSRPLARTSAAAFTLVSAVALAGCAASHAAVVASGSSSPSASSTGSDAGASPASAAPVPLVVCSAQGYDAPVTKAFSAATGIPVKLVDDSTGPLLTKVAAEKDNPQWRLLWVDGDTAFAALDAPGLAAALHADGDAERGGPGIDAGGPLLRAGQRHGDGGADLQRGEGPGGTRLLPGPA